MSLPTYDQAALKALCDRWAVSEMSLFGSAVRSDFGVDSDVDVLVAFQPEAPWTLLDLVRMRDELSELFSRPVDLVERDAVRNPFRRKAILEPREIVYAA